MPILNARLWSYRDGTVIEGSVGADSGVVAAVRVFALVASAVWTVCAVAGAIALAQRKFWPGIPLILIPGLPSAVVFSMLIFGGQQASEVGSELVDELAEVLNAKPVTTSDLTDGV